MADQKKFTLRLINLNCYATEEHGYDDVFLVMNKKKIWPPKKRQLPVPEGTTLLNVNIPGMERGTSVSIEIWDFDFLSRNDLMGHFNFFIDEPGGPYLTDMIPNPGEADHAKYTIEWEIDFDE